MGRNNLESFAIPALDISKLSIADADGFRQHFVKHGLHIAGRAANGLKHFRRRRLLLQRLGEVGGALAQFVQQSRVLDGG